MIVPPDHQLGEVSVLLDCADHDPTKVAAEAYQDLLQKIVSERALGLHALKLHGNGAGFRGSNPDWQNPRAVLLPQNHNWSVRGPIETEMRHRDFDHRIMRSGAGIPACEVILLLGGQRVYSDPHALQ